MKAMRANLAGTSKPPATLRGKLSPESPSPCTEGEGPGGGSSPLALPTAATPTALLCRRIIAFLSEVNDTDPSVDLLDIAWPELACRSLSRRTRGGRMVRVILPPDQFLDHGAQLAIDGAIRIVVNLAPCRALVIRGSAQELCKAAYAIGNLHIPAEINSGEILLPADETVEAALGRLGIAYRLDLRRIRPMLQSLPRVGISGDFQVARQPK